MLRASTAIAAAAALLIVPAGPVFAREVNIARKAGISQTARTFSVNPADFNRDGRQDFFLVRHNPDQLGAHIPYSILYRRGRGGYRKHATKMFRKTDKHDCAWGRANRDRRLDLFCTVGLTQRSVNEMWIQKRGGRFVNRARELGLTEGAHGRYRYATFIHANRDRRPDIYVARYNGGCFCRHDYPGDRWPNELWIRTRSGYRKAPEFGLNRRISASKDNASCAQAIDYDRDGDEDLLVCGQKRLRLYRNRNGRGFRDVTREKNVNGRVVDARLVRVNRGRRADLVRLTRRALVIHKGKRRGGFRRGRVVARPPAPTGLAFGRFNRDKRLDIYVLSSRGRTSRDQPDRILLQRRRLRFRVRVLPRVGRGSGDDVAAIHYNRDGRVEFLVTNGDRKTAGPVQLWIWRRG